MQLWVLWICLCLSTLGYADVDKTLKQPAWVAMVNTWPLPSASFNAFSSALQTADASNTRASVLRGVISRRILAQYLAREHLTPAVNPQKITRLTQAMLARLPALSASQQQVIHTLVKDQQIQQHYLQDIGALNAIHSAKTALMRVAKSIPQAEVARYYAAHPERFKQIDSIQAQHIQLHNQATADLVYQHLQSGLPFSQAVARWSEAEDKTLPVPGDLGTLQNGDVKLTLMQKIALLQPLKQISRPYRARHTWHLYWVRAQTHKILALDGSVGLNIRILLAQQQIRQAYLSTLQNAIQAAKIQLNTQHFKGTLFHE